MFSTKTLKKWIPAPTRTKVVENGTVPGEGMSSSVEDTLGASQWAQSQDLAEVSVAMVALQTARRIFKVNPSKVQPLLAAYEAAVQESPETSRIAALTSMLEQDGARLWSLAKGEANPSAQQGLLQFFNFVLSRADARRFQTIIKSMPHELDANSLTSIFSEPPGFVEAPTIAKFLDACRTAEPAPTHTPRFGASSAAAA